MATEGLDSLKKMVSQTFDRVSQAVGVHVMVLVAEHAQWKIKHSHAQASLIAISEDGISLEQLDELEETKAADIIREFLLEVTSTLGRLVGVQIANQITQELGRLDREGDLG